MKKIGLLFLLSSMLIAGVSAQSLISRNGFIRFNSYTDVEAENHQVTSILNKENGEITFSALIRSFHFEKSLMQEYFNEEYMEAEKFPKAIFKGRIINYESIDWQKKGTYIVSVEGTITIHGISKKIMVDGNIKVDDFQYIASSEFILKTTDFNIQVPYFVAQNIAEQIQVTVAIPFEEKG